MAKIKIIVDTAADMPEELRKKHDIGLLSFLSIFDGKSYVTGVDITNAEFYKMLTEAKNIPTTSQTPYQDMYDYLLKMSREYDSVIYFTISSKGSGQYQTASLIRSTILEEDNPGADIRIVDTMSYSLYIAVTALKAAEMAEEGKTADEIVSFCTEYIKTWHAFLLVDTLKYLEKGGRINKAEAILGTLLDIKPVLTIRNGLVEADDKLRGKKRLFDKLIEKIREYPDFDEEHKEFMIVHSDAEKGEELRRKLAEEFEIDDVLLFGEFGPVVGTHTGPGAAAVIFRVHGGKEE